MIDREGIVETLKRDGFVVVPSFFDADEVAKARQEIARLYEQVSTTPDEAVKIYRAWASTQIMTDLYGRSPALDGLVEKVLTEGRWLLERVGGKRLKNRDYTCRVMTGEPDRWNGFNPPLEWHRDSKGEFIVGIFLTDIDPGDNSATAFLPGSQYFPTDPRWDHLFGRPFYRSRKEEARTKGTKEGLGIFLRWNLFNRLLGKRLIGRATGAFGKAGDFYVFINDTWHGRLPNKNGQKGMVVQLGFFGSEFPFPSVVKPPRPETQARLGPAFQEALNQDQPPNVERDTLIYEFMAKQQENGSLLFSLAKAERRLAASLSNLYLDWWPTKIRLLVAPLRRLFNS